MPGREAWARRGTGMNEEQAGVRTLKQAATAARIGKVTFQF